LLTLYYRFEQVLLLPGHRGSVWGLELTPQDGAQVFSVGQDRTVRVWERGEDLVFVEEER
jgi:U3 small nucleolar RNA-associated protein 12